MRLRTQGLLLIWLLCSACDRGLPPAYRDLDVPRQRLASAEARENGRRLFLAHCALCHGVRADGRGVRRQSLSSRPVDFTRPGWRRRASPRRLFFVVREGIRGTPMPAWKNLDRGEIWDVVAYVLSVAGQQPAPRGEAETTAAPPDGAE